MLLALTGSFGAPLAGEREEPILLLLEGVQVPGVFRHGEAALEGGLALADLTLMAVVTYGCKAVWQEAEPEAPAWPGLVLPAGAILTAGVIPPQWQRPLTAYVVPVGNLILGILIPAVTVLIRKGTKRTKTRSIFSV